MTRYRTVLALGALLGALLGGCVAEASLLSNPAAPACDGDIDVVTAPVDVGCTTIEIEGSDELACDYAHIPDAGPTPTQRGRWVRVRRVVDRPTLMRVELVSHECAEGPCGGEVRWHAGDGCSCGDGFEAGWVESGIEYSVRIPPGDSALLLPESSRRYRVHVCTLAPEPWPTYPECGLGGHTSSDAGGTCRPSCFTDADCPVPSSGTAVARCAPEAGHCSLPCDGGETCPDGQICGTFRDEQLCLVPDGIVRAHL